MIYMTNFYKILGLVLGSWSSLLYATICPDPQTSSLQWGEPPPPWKISPFSNRPQGEEGTRFVRANILVAGYGRGVTCTYRNSIGNYTIWWEVATKIPARIDNNWIDVLGGFVCSTGLQACNFYTVSED